MAHVRLLVRLTLAAGALSLLALVVSHLALVDVAHGAAYPAVEWRALQASFVLIVLFHLLALWTLVRALRILPQG
jgi:hypothetical protein